MTPGAVAEARPRGPFRRAWAALQRLRRRLDRWRRLRFTRGGLVFTVGALAVGWAALNTGNNLLHLLFGGMLGFIAVSGWLSERAIRGLHIARFAPRGVPVGRPVRITYSVRNGKRRLPSLAVEIYEAGLPEPAFVARVAPGETVTARSANRFVQRGVYPLSSLTLSTSFPFGLFVKERDVELRGELVIWPRSDRAVRVPVVGGGPVRSSGRTVAGAPGSRGDYRGLREYRIGDDPRDIHWRTTARRDAPVVREYDRDATEALWICLDAGAEPGDAAEAAVEIAASLAAHAARDGRRFGLVAGDVVLRPDTGAGHLEGVFDALARIDFEPGAPPPAAPVPPDACVLVSATGRGRERYGDAITTRAGVGEPLP